VLCYTQAQFLFALYLMKRTELCPACVVQTPNMDSRITKRILAFLMCMVLLAGVVVFPADVGTDSAAAGFTVPSSSPFKLDGEYLKGVELYTTVGEFAYYYGDGVTVKSAAGKALSAGDTVATGCTLTVNGNTVTLIVNGDADGDGDNTDTDAAIAKAILLNTGDSSQYGKIVAELTGDGIISTADYLKLKHSKEVALLVQSAPSTVKVPNVKGMTEKQAKDAITAAGLVPVVRYTTAGTAGTVSYQKVKAGVTAGEGASITFTVTSDGKYAPINYDRMKGIWLYQYITGTSLFKSSGSQRSESSYRGYVQTIINNMSRDGFNTVFLQMRPNGDALYPSDFYPPSPYASNSTGYSGSFTYDPLEIFIEIAHAKGISVHAWLNPMRLMSSISSVPTKYKLGEWYQNTTTRGDYVVKYGSLWYLDPAYAETRKLVTDGCMEICRNYDIDGIHFDDYFYIVPDDELSTNLAFDQKAFNALGTSYGSASSLDVRKRWRRDNVNKLLNEIFTEIKNYDDRILFGISPAGNIDNNQNGYLCADIKTWCSTPGYVDYIAPQVYWSFSHSWDQARFDICTNNWANLVTCDQVDLVIGMAPYRIGENTSSDPDWYSRKDNMARMLNFTKNHEDVSGFIMFKYESLYGSVYSSSYNSSDAWFTTELAAMMPLVAEW